MDDLKWRCLYDKLIVRRAPADTQIGSILVADAHQKDQNFGTVVQAGDGRWVDGVLLPLTIRVGMTVLFSKFAGVPLADSDPDLVIIREDEVLAFRS